MPRLSGPGRIMADRAKTVIVSPRYKVVMDQSAIEGPREPAASAAGGAAPALSGAATRRSFERQASLFAGPGAVFGESFLSVQEWLEPLSPDWIALDVACRAAAVG